MYKLLPIVHILAKLGILVAALLMLPALISWIFGDGLAMYLTSISMVTMFIAIGLIEAIPIIAAVIAIVLVFANPFVK